MAVAGTRIVNTVHDTPTEAQKTAADPAHSAWVAASAGSGKTRVLVDRVIRLMLAGAAPDSILCLTFTKAAAAEMADRLFKRLSEWVALDDVALGGHLRRLGVSPVTEKTLAAARRLFATALETPGGLKIQTIHAFCERLLQLFPVESGMAPGFRVMTEDESAALSREALLASLASEDAETQSAWAFLDDGSVSGLDKLEKLARPFLSSSNGMRQRLSDLGMLSELEAMLKDLLGIEEARAPDAIAAELCDVDTAIFAQAYTALLPFEKNKRWGVFAALAEVIAEAQPAQRFEPLQKFCFKSDGEPRPELVKDKALQEVPQWCVWLSDEHKRLVGLFHTWAAQTMLTANLSIYRAMAGVVARINDAKRARGLYDFDDLIARTAGLLEGSEAAQWVLYKLDKGLSHILVDEAQDTSPAQWRIIQALAGEFFTGQQRMGETRTVFAVGDIKQSIYSFQGADIAAFETARQSFANAVEDAQQRFEVVDLTVSYRSAQDVLDVVDTVFADDTVARQGFGPRASQERPHTAHFAQRTGLVELWEPTRKLDAEAPHYWRAPVDLTAASHPRLQLAERIAVSIESWIGRRRIAGRDRLVTEGDILILLQRRNVMFNALLGALRRRGIAVAGADRLKLQDSMIVRDLLMLGQVLRMPDDDHALACLLKSPLVPQPLDEMQLLALAHARGSESLWQRLAAASANKVFLQELSDMQATPFEIFHRVLQGSKRLVLERLGSEADDAAEEFLSLALDYERQHGVSFTGFLDWFSQGETEIKREMAKPDGKLRIMTAHGAKGLEAPIVILADAADDHPGRSDGVINITSGSNTGLRLFLPKTDIRLSVIEDLKAAAKLTDMHERMRLLYVGMTRAEDELYICGSLQNKHGAKLPVMSWYAQVAAAFAAERGLAPITDLQAGDGFTIKRFGVAPDQIEKAARDKARTEALPAWAMTPVAHSVTQLPRVASRKSAAFDKQAVAQGLAVHRLVEALADVSEPERISMGERLAHRLKLEAALVPGLVTALASDELAPFFTPDGQSEAAIEGWIEGLGIVSGRIDRIAVTPEAIHVLDYKTNRHPPSKLTEDHDYARQMARYAALLSQVYPGRMVKAALLWTQEGRVEWLSQELLSRALDGLRKEMA
jgi:ATP-dependent helicase/nuclease subunit A